MKRLFFGFFYTMIVTVMIAVCATWVHVYFTVPSEITLFKGNSSSVDFGAPFLELTQEKSNDETVEVSNSLVQALDEGVEETSVSLMGIIPLKRVKVKVVPNDSLMVSGKLVGLKIRMGELLIVKIDNVKTVEGEVSPGENAGLQKGDYIVEAEGQKLNSVSEFAEIVKKSKDDTIDVVIKRNDEMITKRIYMAKSEKDSTSKAGIWLRDGITGLGTLTYLKSSGETINYGCLGHAITDVDTGVLMPVKDGRLYDASMVSSEKGQVGKPGEIKGVINETEVIGDIRKNTEKGVYGCIDEMKVDDVEGSYYLPADKYSVHEGAATILTEAIDNKIETYNVEIESINRGTAIGTKGFKVKITDERLLEKTGGIIQGMSGSPVIQNGKLVGAVTHVLVNDPTRGYGIFVENMLEHN